MKDNLSTRRHSVREAEAVVDEQAKSFLRRLDGRAIAPTIAALHGYHNRLRVTHLECAHRLLAAGTPAKQVLDQLAPGSPTSFCVHRRGCSARPALANAPNSCCFLARAVTTGRRGDACKTHRGPVIQFLTNPSALLLAKSFSFREHP